MSDEACVVVVGSLSLDELLTDEGRERRLGGTVTYSGLTFRQHAVETTAVFNVSREGRPYASVLEDVGVVCRPGASGEMTSFMNQVVGDHRRQWVSARSAVIRSAQVSRALTGAVQLVYLGPLHPEDIAPDATDGLKKSGLRVALDVQGLTRAVSGEEVRPGLAASAPRFLEAAHIVKADRGELGVMLREFRCNIDELLHRFEIEELVETRGDSGGRIHRPDEEPLDYDAVAAEAVDTTGAGDVFLASYLCARFWRKADILQAAEHAATTAAAQVAGNYIPLDALRL